MPMIQRLANLLRPELGDAVVMAIAVAAVAVVAVLGLTGQL